MNKFLSKLLRIKLGSFEYETSKRVYIFSCVSIKSDLFLVEFYIDLVYWVNVKTIAERNAEIDKYLEDLYFDFDLTDLSEVPEPVIKPKKPSVKKAVKKAAKKK